jgi:hypothetical protein
MQDQDDPAGIGRLPDGDEAAQDFAAGSDSAGSSSCP